MKYVYFFSFAIENNGVGRTQDTLSKPITNMNQIREFEKDMTDFYGKNVAVTNFILLREEEE